VDPSALRFVAFSQGAKDMAENVYRSMWTLIANLLVTVIVTMFTKPLGVRIDSDTFHGSIASIQETDGMGFSPWPRICHIKCDLLVDGI
jgi:hypothetical protein